MTTSSSICKNQLRDIQNSSVPNSANATIGNRVQVDDASLRVDVPSLNNTRQFGEQAIAGGSFIASPARKGTLGVEDREAQVMRQDGTQDAGTKRQGQAVREKISDAKGTRQVHGLSEHNDVRGRRGGQHEGEGGRNRGGQQESQGVDHSLCRRRSQDGEHRRGSADVGEHLRAQRHAHEDQEVQEAAVNVGNGAGDRVAKNDIQPRVCEA
mmetsp:Transcript_84817/g.216021  ORF Transcript_84817/g.216021 Transcript_84817/m.216021 type:complete len:211 (+) Transcript_84817:56-688(+)